MISDLVSINEERALRVALEAHGLTDKAEDVGIELAITGDSMEICSTKSANQCTIGFKLTDMDKRHPVTRDKAFYNGLTDEDGVTPMVPS